VESSLMMILLKTCKLLIGDYVEIWLDSRTIFWN